LKRKIYGIGYADAGRDLSPRTVLRNGCSFGFIGHSDAEDGKAESLQHLPHGWCITGVERSESDMTEFVRAWPCVYLGWSSGRDKGLVSLVSKVLVLT
jgi:hypothetical protein